MNADKPRSLGATTLARDGLVEELLVSPRETQFLVAIPEGILPPSETRNVTPGGGGNRSQRRGQARSMRATERFR